MEPALKICKKAPFELYMPERKFGPKFHHPNSDFEIASHCQSGSAFDSQSDSRVMVDPTSPWSIPSTEVAGIKIFGRSKKTASVGGVGTQIKGAEGLFPIHSGDSPDRTPKEARRYAEKIERQRAAEELADWEQTTGDFIRYQLMSRNIPIEGASPQKLWKLAKKKGIV